MSESSTSLSSRTSALYTSLHYNFSIYNVVIFRKFAEAHIDYWRYHILVLLPYCKLCLLAYPFFLPNAFKTLVLTHIVVGRRLFDIAGGPPNMYTIIYIYIEYIHDIQGMYIV